MNDKNFGYLGTGFQQQLLKTLIEDKKFSIVIIDSMDSKYFDGPYFKYLMENIKELYNLYGAIPDYTTLEQKIMKENRDVTSRVHLDTLNAIRDLDLPNAGYVKDISLNFCKQQVLKKSLKEVEEIMNNGDFEEYHKIEEIVQKALQVGSTTDSVKDIFEGVRESLEDDNREPFPTGIVGIDNLLKGGVAKGELALLIAPLGVGKALGVSEPVLCPKGWKTMGEIKLGDKVMGSDGKDQYVIGVYPQGLRPIFKIEFTDGTSVNCDEEHLWSVNTLNMRSSKTHLYGKVISVPNLGYKVMKTSEMMKDIKKRGVYNYRLPMVSPVEFENKDILIDPYLLGILLGDGSITNSGIRIDTKDDEIFDNIKHLQLHTSYNEYNRLTNTGIKTIKRIHLKKQSIKNELEFYGLFGKKSNDKFIPKDYLYNSSDVRISLLQGLLDTDGYISKSGIIQYSTASEELSNNIRELVLSLGGTVRIRTKVPKYTYNGERKIGKLSHLITISFANNVVPFKLIRKNINYHKRLKYTNQKFIKSITYSHNEEAVCIKVSNFDELFVTRDYVLTHNTTWLTKAANTAYNVGGNVLHIFFEDNERDIRRKHYTCWTNYSDTEQLEHKEEVIQKVAEKRTTKHFLKLVKLPPTGVSVNDIRSIIRKLSSEGQHIDMLVIDYVDCISSERNMDGDEWKGEGAIMRSIESMKDEFNIAIWVATQGNRESLSSEVVTTDQIGGSIKKAQIGHIVISVGKTLEQKDNNLATVTLLKSRIGKDGVVFTNCKFNNEYLDIDTDSQNTLLGHEEQVAKKKTERAATVYKAAVEKDERKLEAQVEKILESRILALNQSHEIEQTQEVIDEFGAIELKDDTDGDADVGITADTGITADPGTILSPEEKNRLRLKELAAQRKHKVEEMEVNTG